MPRHYKCKRLRDPVKLEGAVVAVQNGMSVKEAAEKIDVPTSTTSIRTRRSPNWSALERAGPSQKKKRNL